MSPDVNGVTSQRGTTLVDLSCELFNGMPAHALFPSPIILPYVDHLQAKAAEVTDGGDAFFGDDFVKAAIAKGSEYRSFDQKTGNYNQFWIAERSLENRTSLIVDPPDGQLPTLTPAGRVRMADLGRKFAGHQPAGPEDLSPQVRCITYGVPYILAGYNSYFHFLQTPDHVVIY